MIISWDLNVLLALNIFCGRLLVYGSKDGPYSSSLRYIHNARVMIICHGNEKSMVFSVVNEIFSNQLIQRDVVLPTGQLGYLMRQSRLHP